MRTLRTTPNVLCAARAKPQSKRRPDTTPPQTPPPRGQCATLSETVAASVPATTRTTYTPAAHPDVSSRHARSEATAPPRRPCYGAPASVMVTSTDSRAYDPNTPSPPSTFVVTLGISPGESVEPPPWMAWVWTKS